MNNFEFPVSVYGKLEKYNDVLSKGRCRIFYKYGNRNGTYITDEFSEKLLSTIAYAPVKGIYEYDDFTDHGARRSEGRIYGIVPENPHLQWEEHEDEDGVARTYACVDVLIFTALYKEASDIIGKAQSMELYEPSLQYHREIIHGQQYIVFDEGCFLGLQVLGKDVEPCFEGAAFFQLQENIEEVVKKIQEIEMTYSKGGQKEMPQMNFKLSDSQKFDALWSLLNPNYTEEGNWTIDYAICDVYDEYALAYSYENAQYERVYYTKNDETDSVALGEKVRVYVVDVTEKEKTTLDTLRDLNGGTYELVNENLEHAQENAEKISGFELKVTELENNIATLNTEKSAVQSSYELEHQKVESLTAENEGLKQYKLSIEAEQKNAVFTEYKDKLSEEILDTYREKAAEYSVADLDKELAYELKKTNFSFYEKKDNGYLRKDVQKNGIDEILARYVK
jgi:hypothetical protein|nr:MAG TPA: hypothetical protein [Caudoviricetes sp.]